MLELKNVSKFYYNKGIVTSGFSKINLKFKIGEFVAITGESGSGKSTLLNVLSGLDSYEEGEMYINGEETSHYNKIDFENYRKKYIANIFQNFNLINSYTVYQNIELVLLINGFKKKEVKEKILEIIKKVGLEKYRKTKVSKLSGGQKQRVAIARALAKNTSIIIADEPTGNLDKRSAESVLKLLSEIANDKLVIVVTHNYDQISEYATRKIKMHDGKVIEDKEIKKVKTIENPKESNFSNISFLNKIRISIRNTFNVIPKFLLLLLVYLFITISVVAEYSSYKSSNYEMSTEGYNSFFNNISDKRIVIKKNDNTMFTSTDYENIKKLNNIDYIVENDLLLDNIINIYQDDLYFQGYANDIKLFNETLDVGRMPENDNEIVVECSKDDYYFYYNKEEIFNKEYSIENSNSLIQTFNYKLKIVGIKYRQNALGLSGNYIYYVSNKVLDDIRKTANIDYSDVEILFNNNILKSFTYDSNNMLYPMNKIEKGKAIISENLNYLCKDFKCINNSMTAKIKNIYYNDSLNLTISNTYNKDSFKKVVGDIDYNTYNGAIFINDIDYYNLFNKDNYQSSIFVKNPKEVYKTINELKELNLKTLYIKDTLVNPYENITVFTEILTIVLIGILLISIFFISYFIIKLILKSRNIYFSTLRILGASKKVIKQLIDIELYILTNLSYFLVIAFILLNKYNIIYNTDMKSTTSFLKTTDYIVIYLLLIVMSRLLSRRFSKGLFKNTMMNTYREEV